MAKFPLQTTSYKDFSGGLNLSANMVNLKPTECPYILNYVHTLGAGLTSRTGMSLIVQLSGATAPVNGFFFFKPETSNPKVLLAIQNGTLYSIRLTDNTKTTLLTGLSTTAISEGIKFNGDFWITNSTDGLIHIFYSGSTLTAAKVSSAPLSDHIENNGKGRLILCSGRTLYYCAYENGLDWSTTNNAGFLIMDSQNTISAIRQSGNVTYVNANGLYNVDLSDPTNPQVNPQPFKFNMASSASAVVIDKFMYFLTSSVGIYSMQYYGPQSVSDQVIPAFIQNPSDAPSATPSITFNTTYLNKAAAVQDGRWYRLSLPKAGSTYNNCQLLLYLPTGTYTYFEGQNIAFFAQDTETGALYGADSVNGNVYLMNVGNTDNGTPIALDFYSAPYDAGIPEAPRINAWSKVQTSNAGNDQVYFEYINNLGDVSDSIPLTAGATANVWGTVAGGNTLMWGTDPNNPSDLWSTVSEFETKTFMHGRGAWVQGRFYSSGVSSQININAWEIATVQLVPN